MKILVTFASSGGNTMMVAEKIVEVLGGLGQSDVTLKDMEVLKPEELMEYECVFIGSSTWGDSEYNDYSHVFFEQFDASSVDLSAVRFAIYGLGETFYPIFCGVVDLMKTSLVAKKAKIIGESLKIDGFPDELVMESVTTWTTSISSLL